MPEFGPAQTEDRQRMQAGLADVMKQLVALEANGRTGSAVAGNESAINALREQYQRISQSLGRDPSLENMYRDVNAYKQQGDKFNPIEYFSMNENRMPQATPGGLPAPSIGGKPTGMNPGGSNPYSYIVNPNAYQYGGKPGMAEQEQERYAGLSDQAAAERARYAGQYQQGFDQSGQSRDQQLQGLNYLRGIAEGTGPSAAQNQMMQGLAAARNQQASIAANARGGAGGMLAAQQAGANAAGQLSTQGVTQAAGLRAQEQLGAIGQYGQLAGQVREGDLDTARLGAGQQLAATQQQQTWDQYRQAVMAQQSGYQQSAEQQNLAREGAIRGWDVAQSQINDARTAQWIAAISGGIGSLGSLAGAFQPKPKATP